MNFGKYLLEKQIVDQDKVVDFVSNLLDEIQEFFRVYKNLQKKSVEVGKWRNKAEAEKDIQKSFELYDAKFTK